MQNGAEMNRRRFLRKAGAAAALGATPYYVPSSVLAGGQGTPPSQRITLGVIGLGARNRSNLTNFLAQGDVQCRAVCDCFADRRAAGKKMVDGHYGNKDCAATRWHEEVLGRDDIDAVLIGTGDRWHAVLSMLAAKAGKDVYCEKPFCLTIGEGRRLVETRRRYGTVWQCGTQPRSILAARSVPRVSWTHMSDHVRNFLNCIRSRRQPVSFPELAQRAHTICHCANICLRLGRGVRWDATTERFVNDAEANRMLHRAPRPPWRV